MTNTCYEVKINVIKYNNSVIEKYVRTLVEFNFDVSIDKIREYIINNMKQEFAMLIAKCEHLNVSFDKGLIEGGTKNYNFNITWDVTLNLFPTR